MPQKVNAWNVSLGADFRSLSNLFSLHTVYIMSTKSSLSFIMTDFERNQGLQEDITML